MDALSQIWQRVVALWEHLPSPVREPPGLYVTIAIGSLVFYTLFFGWERRRPSGLSERLAQRDVRAMIQAGNFREAGRHYEAIGKPAKALDLYHRGRCHAEEAALLLEMGKRGRAKELARGAGLHGLHAELARQDGELLAAAISFERDGQVYQAAQCYEQAGDKVRAARGFLAANLEGRAVALLEGVEGAAAAGLLEEAIRASLKRTPGTQLSLELAQAVRRAAQLHLAQGAPERAFKLAVDAGDLEVAVPIARDYLPPSEDAAALCVRAGAPLVAAEIYQRLGNKREEALQRAEHHLKSGQPEKAATHFEEAEELSMAAEIWAAQGNLRRAADLFGRSGELEQAADLYGRLGDVDTQRHLFEQLESRESRLRQETEQTSRFAPNATVKAQIPGPETVPQVVRGRYRLQSELGRGGMGIVYRAEDAMLHREVAYKVLPPYLFGRDQNPEQLLAEARAAARLSHPNIVQVYDAGRDENGFFVVMELVRGEGLDVLLARREMTLKGVVMVAEQICSALAHAHDRRIVHRDLKPSNLIWSDAEKRIKLTDFGLARIFEDSGKVQTQPAGTPSYMSPEQIRGEAVGPPSDIYALGCLLFEMLCRRSVFGSGPRSLHQHLNAQPDDPRNLRPETPPALAELILRCLAKEPDQRPPAAAEIGRLLAAIAARRPPSA
jgi:tetratricopeptide (TPR) repeat protein